MNSVSPAYFDKCLGDTQPQAYTIRNGEDDKEAFNTIYGWLEGVELKRFVIECEVDAPVTETIKGEATPTNKQ